MNETFEQRFWVKLTEMPSGCWIWNACLNNKGYGYIQRGGGTGRILAHRAAYELVIGKLTHGLELDHECQTPACANPFHCEEVTHQENLRRGRGFTGRNARATKCPHGHSYDEENTGRIDRGHYIQRYCKQCNRDRASRNYERIRVGHLGR